MAENVRLVTVDTVAGTETPVGSSGGFLSVAGNVPKEGQMAFTRPNNTTAYASGNLVANDTVAANVVALQVPISRVIDVPSRLTRLNVRISLTAAAKAAIIRVHLFKNAPVVTVGDGGVFNVAETYAYSSAGGPVGYQDVTLSQLTNDNTAFGFAAIDIRTRPAAGTQFIYALLESRSVWTPAALASCLLLIESEPG